MKKKFTALKFIAISILSGMFLLHPNLAFTQNTKIEVSSYFRYDNYPQVSYQIDQLAKMDTLKMTGNSYGVNLNYVVPGFKNTIFKIGLGYYRYSFTKIRKTRIANGVFSNGREILYPSPTTFLYLTDRYWYHTASVNLALEKEFVLSESINLQTGISVSNYFTFSQYYHITAGDIDFKNNRFSYFGSSLALNASLLKRFNKMQIGPSLAIPLIDMWKKDMLLPENYEKSSRWKFLNGFAIGLSINYSIDK